MKREKASEGLTRTCGERSETKSTVQDSRFRLAAQVLATKNLTSKKYCDTQCQTLFFSARFFFA